MKRIIPLLAILLLPVVMGMTLDSPVDNAQFFSTPILFNWTSNASINDTTEFQFNLSQNYDMSAPLYSVVQTNNSLNYTAALEGTYYWRVWSVTESLNASNDTVYSQVMSEIRSLTVQEPEFNLTLGATEVLVNESILIYLNGPNGSSVNLSISGPVTTDVYSTPVNEETTLIYIPTDEGQYTVTADFGYETWSDQKIKSFDASVPVATEPLVVSYTSSVSEPVVNVQTAFTSQVENAQGPITYAWDVGLDGTIDGDQSGFTYAFPSAGSYSLKLTVTSQGVSAESTQTWNVLPPSYTLGVSVKDDNTGSYLGDVLVQTTGHIIKTNSRGSAEFNLLEGNYQLNLSRDGYVNTTRAITLNENKLELFQLEPLEIDYASPQVSIVNPQLSIEGDLPSLPIVYSVSSDYDIVDCRINYNLADFSGWRTMNPHENPSSQGTFTLLHLQSGKYRYRVKCTDENREVGYSKIRYFDVITTNKELVDTVSVVTNSDLDKLTLRFDDLLATMTKLSGPRLQIAQGLGLVNKIKTAKKQASTIQKNFESYQKLGLTDQAMESKRKEAESALVSLLDALPANIVEVSEHEFIGVTNNEGIKKTSAEFLEEYDISASSSSLQRYYDKNIELQKLVNIYTRATVLDVMYGDGSNKRYTLINREIQGDVDLTGTTVMEILPQSYELTLLTSGTVLTDDKYQFRVETEPALAYVVAGEVSPVELESIKSTLIYRDVDIRSPSKITGLAIFQAPKNKTKLVFSEAIVMLLAGFMSVFVYTKHIRVSRMPADVAGKQLVALIDQALTELKAGKESGFSKYDAIFTLYAQVDDKLKVDIAPFIAELQHYLNARVAIVKVKEAHSHLGQSNMYKARIAHKEAHSIRQSLPKRHHAQIDDHIRSLDIFYDLKKKGAENQTENQTNEN